MNPQSNDSANPYVGPRTFEQHEGPLFFGRDREARDLLSRVVSERLLLFYAQSGAGKSSLINTRLVLGLQNEGFVILPICRVIGESPLGDRPHNIFLLNLMRMLDSSDTDPALLAGLTFSEFLKHLTTHDGKTWRYDPQTAETLLAEAGGAPDQPFVLIIDQFEEIITSHPECWRDREGFFSQLNDALIADPNLWVVLTLREDYIAALDPYAPLMFNRMRPRFYMERMDASGARQAIEGPARVAGRAFAPGVADRLVNDLCQVRVPGREETITGQYVEPVQLQVVCRELWENLDAGAVDAFDGSITFDDLDRAGDVDKALTQFYEESLALALARPAASAVSERKLREWFQNQLITPAGTRGLVHQESETTGGLPNEVVSDLQKRFLVRSEVRAGSTWVELVHDRLVDPILESNDAWFEAHLSVLQQQALLWQQKERPEGLLLRGDALTEAEQWAQGHPGQLQEYEEAFLLLSIQEANKELATDRFRRRLITALAIIASIVALIAAFLAYTSYANANLARNEANAAETAEAVARLSEQMAVTQAYMAGAAEGTAQFEAERANDAADSAFAVEAQARSTADAALTREAQARGTAVGALSTSEANLIFFLTAAATPPASPTAQSTQAAFTATPTPPSTGPTVTPAPTETAVVFATPNLYIRDFQLQLDSIVLAQEFLENPATPTPRPTAGDVNIIANWVGIDLRADQDSASRLISNVPPWQASRVLESTERWVFVQAPDGSRGWVDGRWRVFTGDAEALPASLSYRVIAPRDNLPFVWGEVVQTDEPQENYILRFQPTPDSDPIVDIPVGTEVIVLLADQGESNDWLLVSLYDVQNEGFIRTGYLEQAIVEETDPYFESCPGAAEARLAVGLEARVLSSDDGAAVVRTAPDARGIVGEVPEGSRMLVLDKPVCANGLLWWHVETESGLNGWTPEGRPGDYLLEPLS